MAFRFITVPISQAEAAETELNSFLRGHRVLCVDRRWVDQGPASFWSFCIDYLDSPAFTNKSNFDRGGKRETIDYKQVLSAEEFAKFAQLRDFRKQLAQSEAVPVYTIFTNQQLAQMVQKNARTKANLEEIAGVGDARIEKYGERLLLFLNSLPEGTP